MADMLIDDGLYWDGIGDDWDEYDPIEHKPPKSKTCDFCKTTGLHWIRVKDKWRLADKTGLPHACNIGITNAIFASRKETNEHTDGKTAVHQCGNNGLPYKGNPNRHT